MAVALTSTVGCPAGMPMNPAIGTFVTIPAGTGLGTPPSARLSSTRPGTGSVSIDDPAGT